MTTYADNILACLYRATAVEIHDGTHWYATAHALALELSPGDVWRGAGVIAAFSPLQQWNINIRNARNAFATGIAIGNTRSNNAIAQRILDGENAMDVLNGDKTRAFASAIALNGKSDIATIDRHAHDIAFNSYSTDKTRNIGKRLYRELSDAYRIVAHDVGVSVNTIQAITWVTWRREKGII